MRVCVFVYYGKRKKKCRNREKMKRVYVGVCVCVSWKKEGKKAKIEKK